MVLKNEMRYWKSITNVMFQKNLFKNKLINIEKRTCKKSDKKRTKKQLFKFGIMRRNKKCIFKTNSVTSHQRMMFRHKHISKKKVLRRFSSPHSFYLRTHTIFFIDVMCLNDFQEMWDVNEKYKK